MHASMRSPRLLRRVLGCAPAGVTPLTCAAVCPCARPQEDSWRNKNEHVNSLWMKAVERNDRKWLMLAAFLLTVAVGLLTVVAWRLEHLEHLQHLMPNLTLLTLHAALAALLPTVPPPL
jgi:hypothetical protein